jgi:hypothetical protein
LFRDEEVNGESLLKMTFDDLKNNFTLKIGTRIKLWSLIEGLQEESFNGFFSLFIKSSQKNEENIG